MQASKREHSIILYVVFKNTKILNQRVHVTERTNFSREKICIKLSFSVVYIPAYSRLATSHILYTDYYVLRYVIAGGSRLGFCRDGSRSPLPVDVHDSFNSRNLHNSMRSTGALRRHETNRYGIFFCCSTAIPATGSRVAEDYRIVGVFVRARAMCF